MAEAIGAAIFAAAGAAEIGSTAIVGTLTAAQIVGGATLLGGTFLLSALTSPGQKDKIQSQQTSFRQAIPSRSLSFGRVKRAGPKIAYDSVGGAVIDGVYLGEGPWDAIEFILLDNVIVAIAAETMGGVAGTLPWGSYVSIEKRLGTPEQPASALLLGSLPYWTPQHQLNGCAYVVCKSQAPAERNFKKVYTSGKWPEIVAVGRANRVRDVRDPAQTEDPESWKWSDRSGPCIYGLMTHRMGLAMPHALLNQASWAAFNAICDENVVNRAGDTVARYLLGGSYEVAETDPADVLQQMLDTCDARLTLEPDGTIGITGGKFPTSTVTITDPTIISGEIERGSGKLASFNRLKGTFLSPLHEYQQVEATPWINTANLSEAGELLEAPFDRPWVPFHNQVRRLAKIHDAKGNPAWRATGLVTDLSAAPALFEEAIRLRLTEFGIDEVFLIDRPVANLEGGTCTFDLSSLSPGCYDFDAATEEGDGPALPGSDAAPAQPEAPANLIALVEQRNVNGDTAAVFARLISAAPDREDFALIGRYRRVGDDTWIDMAPEGDGRASLISSVLADGEIYEFEGAIATYGRTLQSDWIQPEPAQIMATADISYPGQVYNVVLTSGSGEATIAWTMPNEPSIARADVYSGAAGSTFSAATCIRAVTGTANQQLLIGASFSAGAHRIWIRAANRSGYPSDPADLSSTVGPFDFVVS